MRIAIRKFDPFESTLKKLWDSYCETHQLDIQAEMIPLDLHELYDETITKNGLRNGDWDIAHINTDWIFDAANQQAVLNLSPLIAQNSPADFPQGWHNSLLKLQNIKEGIYGLPFHDGPECLIYRKDLFDDPQEQQKFYQQHGYALQVPQTWEQFETIAAFFNRPAQNLYGCVFANYPDGHNMVFDFCLQLWTRGGELLDETQQVNIHTDTAIAGLDFYRRMVNNTATTHPGSKEFESVKAGLAFANGEAAMAINWFGFASMCEVIPQSKVKGKVDISSLPAQPGQTTATLNVYWLYTIASGSKNKDLAYDFLRFATTPSADKLLTTEGGIGCRKTTWNDPEINQIIPYYHKLHTLHENAKTLPQLAIWPQIAEVIDQVVVQAISTEHSSAQLLAKAQEQINQMI
ncbi:MAG: extracellular solute-binding protein [Sphingobacteriaceae bacterium]